jgi:hypothetical protein
MLILPFPDIALIKNNARAGADIAKELSRLFLHKASTYRYELLA